ncbi:hypothetical protein LWI29_005192 [Acer saccharum]|uniref:RNase H type-1 domain-containing protein n=1 Tax=Acer saccharum TaxID=4024 RepID=A0AA39T2H7_ACESA|nr:hypothetical protein LWI29_005192 [Acer saccharum]
MDPLKARGPDGLPVLFFHKFWDVVGGNVTSAILDVLNNEAPMEKLGEVVVVLIRKFSRNRLLFGGDCVEQGNFWDRVGKLAEEFRRDGIGVSVPKVCGSGSLGWILPNSGDFKLNIDAALDYDNCRYGAGMVIRDDRGIVVVAAALSFFGKVSMDITEAKAILEGLLLTNNLGLFPMSVKSDALEVVGLCNRKSSSYGDIDNIICDILSLKFKCIDTSIVHVPRECNSVAHFIAHFAVLNGCSNVWSNVFPDWLSVLAKADLSSCNPFFGK